MVKRFVLIVISSVLLIASVVQAQDSIAPIIAVSKGDIYTINPVDGSIKQLTNHHQTLYSDQPGSQRDLALSPDGHYLAYRQAPQFFIEAMSQDLIGNFGESPSDIILLNLMTGEEKVIAQQEPNMTANDREKWWFRSSLSWSSDSTRLIFFQFHLVFDAKNYIGQIMSANIVTNQLTTLVETTEPIWRLKWSGDFILADTSVYTSAGAPVTRFYLTDGMTSNYFIYRQGRDYVMVDSADVIPHDGRMYVMDLLTGEYDVIAGDQASISAVTPQDSLVFIKDDNDTRPRKVVNLQTGATFVPIEKPPYAVDFTFSPDGKQFAYVLLDTSVNISDLNGNERVVPFDADTILWSGKQYTVADTNGDQSAPVEPTTDFFNAKRCGTLPAVHLVAGGQGKVIVGGGPNRVRSLPNADAARIGQIPEGATFNVLVGGQGVCSNGIRWAQVEYQGVTGWTAEGADGQAFLEPVQ